MLLMFTCYADQPDGTPSTTQPQGGMNILMAEMATKKLKSHGGVKRKSMYRQGVKMLYACTIRL